MSHTYLGRAGAAAVAVCFALPAAANIHFKDNAEGKFTITGWTDSTGANFAARPGIMGMTNNAAGSSAGGPGVTSGNGTSHATSSNYLVRPAGVNLGDAGTGMGAKAEAGGACSPNGSAFNSNMGEGTITVINNGAAVWKLNWDFEFSWLSETIGTLPLQESGSSKGEPSLYADGLMQVDVGESVVYVPGGSLTDSGTRSGQIVIKGNTTVVIYCRAFASGSINAIPAPGGVGIAALGALLVGVRRRRQTE